MKMLIYILSVMLFLLNSSCRKSSYNLPNDTEIITDNGLGTGTVTWTKNMNIVIEGFVFVNDGQVLTIEPGTIIRFKEGQGAAASALIIARGGKIIANGTADAPIIFTAISDDLNGTLPKDTTGLWGGVIILGQAPIFGETTSNFIEGIPISEPRGEYGGNLADDNSGELSYVSIRYAGTFLHQGNEINGLTLGGVGNATHIHHIEILNAADDGIEIFGGTVNLDHIITYNAADDAFDFDYGYCGNVQFLLSLQNQCGFDNFIEGSGTQNSGSVNATPSFANLTMLGNQAMGNFIHLNNYAGGIFVNSIFSNALHGCLIDYNGTNADTYTQWKNNKLIVENNLFYQVENQDTTIIFSVNGTDVPEEISSEWSAYFTSGNNKYINTGIYVNTTLLIFPDSQTHTNLYPVSDAFETSNFKGAFGNFDWTADWTYFKQLL